MILKRFRLPMIILMLSVVMSGLFVVRSGQVQAMGKTLYCPADGGDIAFLESGNRKTVQDNDNIYVTRYYAVKTKPANYSSTPEGDYINCRSTITPPKYGGIKPTGAELGNTLTGDDGNCGVSPRTPDVRPPVYRHSHCRESAIVDDGGEVIMNGQTIFCVNMPDKSSDYGSLTDSSSCAGRKVNKKIYPASPFNRQGWVEGAGNLFREDNCPGGGTYNDGSNDGDNSNPLSQIIWCNASTFSWYKGHGFYGNPDFTNLIGQDSSGFLKDFNIRMRSFTSVGNGTVVINITYKYPKSLQPNKSICRQFTGGFGLPKASGSEDIALADINGNIIEDRKVRPGQDILLGVRFQNNGQTTWNGNLGTYALVNNNTPVNLSKAPPPYDAWSVDGSSDPQRVYFQNGTGSAAPGDFVNFWFKIKVPTTVQNQFTLSWKMSQILSYEGRDPGEFGEACSITLTSPQNRPFLRVSGSDTEAGALFGGIDGAVCDSNASQKVLGNALNAKIDTNGYDDAFASTLGASSGQYGVFASGFVNSLASSMNNFFSNNLKLQGERKDLTFANDGIPDNLDKYGQFYDGKGAGLPCVDVTPLVAVAKQGDDADDSNDSFKMHLSNSASNSTGGGSAYFAGQPLYTASAGIKDVQGSKVIVVDGDLNINTNLEYGPGINNMILIVLGNIYIDSSVSRLDGTYIAYPKDSSKGIVDTCSSVKRGDWPNDGEDLRVGAACSSKLTVNGRIIAKKVLWKRTYGSIGSGSSVVDSGCVVGSSSNKLEDCASEFINFTPEAYFNSPIFKDKKQTLGNVPISSVELPPIY